MGVTALEEHFTAPGLPTHGPGRRPEIAARLLFSVDYPFSDNAEGTRFLDSVPLSPADREKLAHGNAEELLRL